MRFSPEQSLDLSISFLQPIVIELKINTKLEDIPNDQFCEACNNPSPMKKKMVSCEQAYLDKGKKCEAVCMVPGYYCDVCDLNFCDTRGSIEALKVFAELIRPTGDFDALEMVEASLKAAKLSLVGMD